MLFLNSSLLQEFLKQSNIDESKCGDSATTSSASNATRYLF